MKLSLSLLLLLSSISLVFGQMPEAKQLQENVGDIPYDPKTDKPDFLCNNNLIFQYYNVNTAYKGGFKAFKAYYQTITNINPNSNQPQDLLLYVLLLTAEEKPIALEFIN